MKNLTERERSIVQKQNFFELSFDQKDFVILTLESLKSFKRLAIRDIKHIVSLALKQEIKNDFKVSLKKEGIRIIIELNDNILGKIIK